jgi:uncharacterized protein YbaR (Trm112 family)
MPPRKGARYRAWAELLKRTFQIDVLCCPKCHGRMKLIAMVTDPKASRGSSAASASPPTRPSASPLADRPIGKARSCEKYLSPAPPKSEPRRTRPFAPQKCAESVSQNGLPALPRTA